MFDDLFKSKEERVQEEVEEHFSAGMQHLADKFFNRAMIEFKKAMDLDKEAVYPRLIDELENATRSGQLEAALSIGLNLLKENPKDFELANKLGNYARELGNYTQAESLYKLALRINRRYERAFFNLAATAARIDIYDDAVKSMLGQFDNVLDFVLPDYYCDEEVLLRLENAAQTEKEKIKEASLAEMAGLKKQAEDASNIVEAGELDFKIQRMQAAPIKVEFEDILAQFDKLIESEPANASKNTFDKGLYCLKKGRPDDAITCFNTLSAKEFELLDLLMAIALQQQGDSEGAIQKVTNLLGENEFNRYNNVNLGLLLRKAGKHFLSAKYLLKTAALLEKSGGIYSMKELVRQGYQAQEEDNYKKALNYLLIAVSEIPDAKMWGTIGDLYVKLKKYDEAVDAFRRFKQLDPENTGAYDKLKEIHDYYATKGDSLLSDRKFKAAVEYFSKALTVLELPDTLSKTASVYKELNQLGRADEILARRHAILQAEKEKEAESERQEIIANAKEELKYKNYLKAAELLESALRMKVDKAVFLQLAGLYKALKKTQKLEDLVSRWEKMVEHQEKLVRYQKEVERAETRE